MLDGGWWCFSHNPDRGGENETGFEMQISNCVPTQSWKSTMFHAKHMITFHIDNPLMLFFYWNERWLFSLRRQGLSSGQMSEYYKGNHWTSGIIMLQGKKFLQRIFRSKTNSNSAGRTITPALVTLHARTVPSTGGTTYKTVKGTGKNVNKYWEAKKVR